MSETVKNLDRLLILGAVLILIMLEAVACQYYQGQRERDVINMLRQEGVWYTNTKYEKFADVDLDSLSKPSGEWTYKTVTVNYTFLSHSSPNDILQMKYILNSTRTCKASYTQQCVYTQVLLVATNNVTSLGRGNPYFDYWGPTESPYCHLLWLTTPTGQPIAWHLYLYLVTHTSG